MRLWCCWSVSWWRSYSSGSSRRHTRARNTHWRTNSRGHAWPLLQDNCWATYHVGRSRGWREPTWHLHLHGLRKSWLHSWYWAMWGLLTHAWWTSCARRHLVGRRTTVRATIGSHISRRRTSRHTWWHSWSSKARWRSSWIHTSWLWVAWT